MSHGRTPGPARVRAYLSRQDAHRKTASVQRESGLLNNRQSANEVRSAGCNFLICQFGLALLQAAYLGPAVLGGGTQRAGGTWRQHEGPNGVESSVD